MVKYFVFGILIAMIILAGAVIYINYDSDKDNCQDQVFEKEGYLYATIEAINSGCVQIPEPNTNRR